MKESMKVRLLVDTSTAKKGATRELNRDRAEAWVKAGWAEYVDRQGPARGKRKDVPEEET